MGEYCNDHTKQCVDVAQALNQVAELKEYIIKLEERIITQIRELKDDSDNHYGASHKLEIAIAGINKTLESYKETMDRLDSTMIKLQDTVAQGAEYNRELSHNTQLILDLLKNDYQDEETTACNTTDNTVVKSLTDTIRESFTTWKVVLLLVFGLIFILLGAKWDDIMKLILGGM